MGDVLIVQAANHLQSVAVLDLYVRDPLVPGHIVKFADATGLELARKREEVARRERGLAGARGTDENDQAKFGDLDRLVRVHRVNTAICVGAPTSSSSLPTGKICNS